MPRDRADEAVQVGVGGGVVGAQLVPGDLDVAGVPEDPANKAEEEDDGAGVDQQVPVVSAPALRLAEHPDEK
ncbi:hypothetical protein chiPu_0031982, partial [Chiloscyllium punctatum]|nr:hypothetical protein [Chiloscyllium punctatum]